MLRTAGWLAFLSEDFVSGLRRPDFAGFVASSPLSYSAAGSLPRPDLHRLALWGFSGHPSSPALRQNSRTDLWDIAGVPVSTGPALCCGGTARGRPRPLDSEAEEKLLRDLRRDLVAGEALPF